MSLEQFLLLKVPMAVLGIVFVGGAVVIAVGGLLIVRRLIPHHRMKVHNDVAAAIFGTVGVIYAVLLAFVVIVVWQGLDRSRINVEQEANRLEDLYRDCVAFRPDFKAKVRSLLKEYRDAVVDDEWKTMAWGERSPKVEKIINDLWAAYSRYEPGNGTDRIFFEEGVHKLNELEEFRSFRLIDSKTGVNFLLWFVLVIGGISTIAFTVFFGAENLKAQVAMAVILSILISLIIFTVFSMDYPFTGEISVKPRAFIQLQFNP